MRKRYTKRGSVRKPSQKERRKGQAEKDREVQLVLDREEMLAMIQDSLTSFATEIGLRVATGLLEDEVNQRCGLRYERAPERTVTRYGHQRGVAVIAGQKLPIPRPRMRYTRRCGEADLETYARLQSPDAMPQAVLKRLVRGVSCRDYEGVVDLAREGFGVQKSSVSRSFVKASAAEVRQLSERRLKGLRIPVIYLDGVVYAGETMTVALGVLENRAKRVLGVRQGATENAAVCTALLEDLQGRGLDTSQPTLLVLDGSKALHAGLGPQHADPTLPGPQEAERAGTPAGEARGGAFPATPRRVQREGLRRGPAAVENNGPLAGPPEPRRGGEPAGRAGGDADGGSSGRSRLASADVGDDQSDRVGVQRGRERDSPGEVLARGRHASAVVCGRLDASRE